MSPGRDAPEEARREAAKAAVLEVARRRFGEDHYEAVQVADIAREAGVEETWIYDVFADKVNLWRAVTDWAPATGSPSGAPVSTRINRVQAREAQREALKAAARRLFEQHGYRGVGVRAVAEAVGISHPIAYKIFGDKDGLWRAAMGTKPPLTDPIRVAPQMKRLLERFVADAGDPEATARTLGDARRLLRRFSEDG